jgi:hypothetical protein
MRFRVSDEFSSIKPSRTHPRGFQLAAWTVASRCRASPARCLKKLVKKIRRYKPGRGVTPHTGNSGDTSFMDAEPPVLPWKETSPMNEQVKFVAPMLGAEETFVDLCERFGISRKRGTSGRSDMSVQEFKR